MLGDLLLVVSKGSSVCFGSTHKVTPSDTKVVTGEPSLPVTDAGTTRVWPRARICQSRPRALTEPLEAGDTEDVDGQRGESQGFSRYAFHDLEPVNITDAVVTVCTDSPGMPVSGFVHPQYLVWISAPYSFRG